MSRAEVELACRTLALGWNLGTCQRPLDAHARSQLERSDLLASILQHKRRRFAQHRWYVMATHIDRDPQGFLRITVVTQPLEHPEASMN